MRALTIAQSISGALQRVSALRSPSSGEVPSGGGGQGGPSRTSGPLSPVREGGLGVAPAGVTSDSIPLDMFSCPGAAGFKVRGPNYLQDKKKVSLLICCLCLMRAQARTASSCLLKDTAHVPMYTMLVLGCAVHIIAVHSLLVLCPAVVSYDAQVLYTDVGSFGMEYLLLDGLGAVLLQVLPDAPVCSLVSLNLLSMAEPTFHIARFLPSIRDSKAPLHFIWHVRHWALSTFLHGTP